jgi:hypothetical protein
MTLVSFAYAADVPDWANAKFSQPPDKVYKLALESIERQKHRIDSQDEKNHTIKFHVGTTAWSWGYNMVLTVKPDGTGSVCETTIDRSGGKAVSWGSGKKEVEKIYRWMNEQLSH